MKTLRALSAIGIVLTIAFMAAGCASKKQKVHYLGDADLSYYKNKATDIDYTDVCHVTPETVTHTDEPRTVVDRRKDEIWDISLEEVLHIALMNNRIIRSSGSFLVPGNALLTNAQGVSSVYDSAIQETGVLFGGRGVEAALSDFDTQFATSMVWGRSENIQNSPFFGGMPGSTLKQDTGTFRSGITKQFAYGATFGVTHDWDYSAVNSTALLFPSSYNGNIAASYRQPLLAGAGAEYTRIAGPLNPNFGGITGVSQGVVIARINNDITLANFEINVRQLLKDTEDLYWDLYLQYRLYDTALTARNSALRTWRDAKAKMDVGGIQNFKLSDEAQARDQYYRTRSDTEITMNNLLTTEVRLRRLIGLSVNDCRVMRPSDEPTTAEFLPDWYLSLTEALVNRVELRKQKFEIKSLELQLIAARSLTKPRLDFVSSYAVNGFGDTLIRQNDDDGITGTGIKSAYGSLTQGDQTSWTLGAEFSMPFGFRSAKAQVRNYELRLAKQREILSVSEQEISHELAVSIQNLKANFRTAQTNFNRQLAAQERVYLFEEELNVGTSTYDLVLRAQSSLADARRAYYQSLIDYNKAITEIYFRKGTLLEHNNVHLEEGGWVPEAYEQAVERAWARSHAMDADCLDTEPGEFIQHCPPWGPTIQPSCPTENVTEPPGQLPEIPLTPESEGAVLPAPAVVDEPVEIQEN